MRMRKTKKRRVSRSLLQRRPPTASLNARRTNFTVPTVSYSSRPWLSPIQGSAGTVEAPSPEVQLIRGQA